jgi:hypothetical protein
MELVFKILRLLGYLLLPMFFKPPANAGLFGLLHAILVIVITVGLHFLQNRVLDLTRRLETGHELVRQNWLPILFLLSYLLLWFGAWLWKLFKIDDEPSRYPDLDTCWTEAVTALQKTGIGIGDTPITLILGRFAGDEASLFQAGPPLAVNGVPGAGAPLRVYAHREGIFVTCTGASVSGRQVELLEGAGTSMPSAGASTGGGFGDVDKSIGMSMASGGAMREVQVIIRRTREEGNRSLTAQEHQMIRELTGVNPAAPAVGEARRSHSSVLKSPEEAEECAARMRYLCRLIGRSRWPLCPLNGIVVLVTLNATDTDDDAQQMGLVVQRDLQAVREAARMHCPVYTLVGDLDRLQGAQEFLAQFPADKRRQRLGKSFPLVPEVEPEKVGNVIESNVRWIMDLLIPFQVFKMFRLEAPGGSATDAIESNAQLFHFLTDLRERSVRLAKLVAKAVVVSLDFAPLFGGCYLAGTDTGGERAFCPGFWKRLEETQGNVAWTAEAFSADHRYRSRTQMGYAALAVALALVAALGFWALVLKGD